MGSLPGGISSSGGRNHLEVLLRIPLAQKHEDSERECEAAAEKTEAEAQIREKRGDAQIIAPEGSLHSHS